MASATTKIKRRFDLATIGGLIVALGGILGGLLLEGGNIQDVQQLTAALIVLGGTLGAVMVNTPMRVLRHAVRSIPLIFSEPPEGRQECLARLIGFATKARRSGIISIDADLDALDDRYMRKALMLAVDGTDPQELRKMMELEIAVEEHEREAVVRVFESAGGYAPTIGIIGAVLGLIQVMKHLENIESVGHGIAVAFVATVYGVGAANLLLLPAANKLRGRLAYDIQTREMILEGVISIIEGMNPKLLQSKLEAFFNPAAAEASRKKKAAVPAAVSVS